MLVTNDHGRHLDGVQNGFVSHGDGCWGCRHIMFLGLGAGVPKGAHTSVRRTIADITPTIGSVLGFPTPYATGKSMIEILTSVESRSKTESLPTAAHLERNFPNPFNPNTAISFQLSAVSLVSLRVFNVLGEEIATLVNEVRSAGTHTVQWNASSSPSGIYFYRLVANAIPSGQGRQISGGQASGYTETRKMILLR
jgi:hypothetical protein